MMQLQDDALLIVLSQLPLALLSGMCLVSRPPLKMLLLLQHQIGDLVLAGHTEVLASPWTLTKPNAKMSATNVSNQGTLASSVQTSDPRRKPANKIFLCCLRRSSITCHHLLSNSYSNQWLGRLRLPPLTSGSWGMTT